MSSLAAPHKHTKLLFTQSGATWHWLQYAPAGQKAAARDVASLCYETHHRKVLLVAFLSPCAITTKFIWPVEFVCHTGS